MAGVVMVKWEYRTETILSLHLPTELNRNGLQGWELVQLLPTSLDELTNVRAVFKRPLVQTAGVAQGRSDLPAGAEI